MNENEQIGFPFMNEMERDVKTNFEHLREMERSELEAKEQSRVNSLFEDPERYFDARRVAIERRMAELEERLDNVSYDEEGQLVGKIENSRYFKHAEKSKDSFNLYIFQADIERLKSDTEEFKKKREDEKEELKVANDLLKIEQTKLNLLDEEILRIHIALLNADDKSQVENTKKLEEKRAEKLDRLSIISYLNNEVLQITTLINNDAPIIRMNIRMNNQLIKTLNQEIDTIKSKENIDYFDFAHFNRDMKELNDLKGMLEHINSYSRIGKNKTKEKTPNKKVTPNKPKPIEPPKGPTDEPTKVPTDEPTKVPSDEPTKVPTDEPTKVPSDEPTKVPSDEPTKVPTDEPTKVPTDEPTKVPTDEPTKVPTDEPTKVPTDEPTKVPTDEPTKVPAEEPMGIIIREENLPYVAPVAPIVTPEKDNWKINGFRLDFFEKYGYFPGEREKRLNPNYNSDYSRLESGPRGAYIRDVSPESERAREALKREEERNERGRLRRDLIVTRIRNVPKEIINAIKNFKDKNFPSREIKDAQIPVMR